MDDLAVAGDLETAVDVAEGDLAEILAIKAGETFIVADPWGDIRGQSDGLFHDGTRLLSRFNLLIGAKRPSRLSSSLSGDGAVFTFNGCNLALPPVGGAGAQRGVIHVERTRCLHEGRLYERLRLANFGLDEVMLPIAFEYAADFHDIFEVRGVARRARGLAAEPELTGRGVLFGYRGLDEVERRASVSFSEPPWRVTAGRADFMFPLSPKAKIDLFIEAGQTTAETPSSRRFNHAIAKARRTVRHFKNEGAQLRAADGAFGAWLEQSRADVAVLTTALSTGPYPYAGIPWFSTPFGRDGIITAWQLLWLDPSLARGVLRYLALRQATRVSAVDDSAPGKIMHETRGGEMATLGEIPFGLYYGGVDTTPLFIALAGAFLERTGDLATLRELWPALLRAVHWLEAQGDSNGDGFIDYQRGASSGLANQGWKDSLDSVFHDDGRFAPGPIALVEVQGYAFAAWRAMARIAHALGEPGSAGWAARSEAMREAVEARFWIEERGYYALAIDGDGKVCAPESSNPGHLLFVGLPGPERAARVTQKLLSKSFDSGWGLRTLATDASRFNPMSYHNGSIWPHDTAIAVMGMSRYGERDGAAKVMTDLFAASRRFDMRMPELLCGFSREADEPPIAYPVACRPQAWAAGSSFMLVQACLGLSIDADRREVRVVRPTLPEGLDRLTLDRLVVGDGAVDIQFQRIGGRIAAIPGPCSDPSVSVILEG
jgi:glycogen debranching enzyme